MAEVEPNDDDVFEIDDFTVVSPLETLVSALEVVIHDLALQSTRPSYDLSKLASDWSLEMKERPVTYESNSFIVRYYKPDDSFIQSTPKKNMANDDSDEEYEFNRSQSEETKSLAHYSCAARQISSPKLDFCTTNNICAMYGVAEFLVLLGEHSTNDRIASQEQKDFVMSAVRVALNNTHCEVPFFVLCGPPERELYYGAAESKTQTMSFLPTHLHQFAYRHTNLTGLIGLMKEKVRTRASVVDLEEVHASVRFEYNLQYPDRENKLSSDRIDRKKLHRDCRDCRDKLEMTLVCLWKYLPETRVHENESFSNLEPGDSKHWELYANFAPSYQPFSQILKTVLSHALNDSSPPAKELYTPPSPSQEQSVIAGSPNDLTEDLRKEVLSPIADGQYPEWTKAEKLNPDLAKDELFKKALDDLRHAKCAPLRSIAARISVIISHVIDDESSIAQIWIHFVRLLREHWENNIQLPVQPGTSMLNQSPNLGSCILNQKLEMLQACITARLQRNAYYDNNFGTEEFFDAEEDLDKEDHDTYSKPERQPSGCHKRMGTAFLHHHPDIPLWIPETQMACPMTEDMVQAHAELLTSLKAGPERTEAQLGILRSDMQAFKAANPKCDLIDFIRWHSPKDWDEETGELSERMKIENNAWERCWKESAPLPAIYQQPHFNEATVAEGILSLFEHATIAQICDWITPILFHFATVQMLFEDDQVREEGDARKMCSLVSRATREYAQPAKSAYYQALHHIRKYELMAHFYFHLWKTFWRLQFLRRDKEEAELRRLVKSIMIDSQKERSDDSMFRDGVSLPGACSHFLGQIIAGDFQGQNGLLQKNQQPSRKSYVLYWNAPVPSSSSRNQPQRIYANIEFENNRICSSTTNDVVFM